MEAYVPTEKIMKKLLEFLAEIPGGDRALNFDLHSPSRYRH